MGKVKKPQLTVYWNDLELKDKFKEECKKERRNATNMLEYIIAKYFELKEKGVT
jgi:hypothetical protein